MTCGEPYVPEYTFEKIDTPPNPFVVPPPPEKQKECGCDKKYTVKIGISNENFLMYASLALLLIYLFHKMT